MRKIVYYVVVVVIIYFACSYQVITDSNDTRRIVKLAKCVDGDTADIIYDGKLYVLRFLGINTKELDEEYGEEASKYTCNILSNSKKIEIEFDSNSDLYDKYDRMLAWVFVDDDLLQLDLVKKGFAEVKYIYGDYKYVDQLRIAEEVAKEKNIGLWKIYY